LVHHAQISKELANTSDRISRLDFKSQRIPLFRVYIHNKPVLVILVYQFEIIPRSESGSNRLASEAIEELRHLQNGCQPLYPLAQVIIAITGEPPSRTGWAAVLYTLRRRAEVVAMSSSNLS
jgi:hypothetical protein